MILAQDHNLLSPELQYGAFAICALLIGVLVIALRGLLKLLGRERKQNDKLSDRNEEQDEIIGNHIPHVQAELNAIHKAISTLACQRGEPCPEKT